MIPFFGRKKKRPRVTLVLGGGSARGIAHIGVLKVLEREGIPIDAVVGTSMGALIGAAYCVGIPLSIMEERALQFTVEKLLDPTLPKMAALEGKKLQAAITELLDSKHFSDARIPLYVVATDIETAEEIYFSAGDLKKVVLASCSWPGVFKPVEIDGRLLVDGGIKNSVPTRIAEMLGAEFTIASDVGFCIRRGKIKNILEIIVQTLQIMGEELNRYQSGLADVTINSLLGDIDQAAFHRARESIRIGEVAAEAKIDEIKRKLGI